MFTKNISKRIWKIQRPLSHSKGNFRECLIYDEGKIHWTVFNMPKDVFDQLFSDGSPKIYVLGEVDKNGYLQIDKKVEWQEW